ncbi:MAG: acyl--CoA ligase [Rhodospirillaceae bacterium]|nr:acyl--CoA ligase [Rhodospirillaceae bacterium]
MSGAAQRIEAVFRANSGRDFLLEPGKPALTYAAFEDRCLRVAGMFQKLGIPRGARVGTLLPNSGEYAALFFGALYAGVTMVPINHALSPPEISFLAGASGIDILVYAEQTKHLLEGGTTKPPYKRVCFVQNQGAQSEDAAGPGVVTLKSFAEFEPAPARSWADAVQDDQTIALVFTSGTTSRPKGIKHRARSYIEAASAFNDGMGFDPGNRFINLWPMAYNTGWLNSLLCPFLCQGSVVIAPVFDAKSALAFWPNIIEHKANTAWLSPSLLTTLNRVDRDPRGPQYCREVGFVVCTGTAPVPIKVKTEFEQKYGVEAFESYGVSEVLFVSMNMPRHTRCPGAAGRVIPGIDIAIVNDAGAALKTGEEGEIIIRSPWFMKGYHDFDDPNAPSHNPMDPFASGDIGKLDAEGNLYITGRKKDLIIRGGLNLSPRAIEDVIAEHPGVEAVAVVGIPHEVFGEEVVAALQMKAGFALENERAAILALCRGKLSSTAVPTKLVAFAKLPQGATGKILKREIRAELTKAAS